jgi:glycerol-3-phosphate acyltransferase PlsX
MNGIRVAAEFAHAEVNAGIEAALLSSTATP